MIFLTKGQTLYDNPGMVIYDQTGYYEDGDSVICAAVSFPEEPVCRYEAKFIAYGSMVYTIADPDLLLEEVKKINPDTLFGKTNADRALDKLVNDIVPQEQSEQPVSPEPTTEPTTEEITMPTETTGESVPEVPTPEVAPVEEPTPPIETSMSTTTPTTAIEDVPVVDSTNFSTSTEAVPDTTTP